MGLIQAARNRPPSEKAARARTCKRVVLASNGQLVERAVKIVEALGARESVSVGKLQLQAIHTPGHTPGSCVFITSDDEPILLSGDLLFAGSVGRTDLPRGSWEQQMDSLRRVVPVLPGDTAAHPRPGPGTPVAVERPRNPFLRPLRSTTNPSP